MSPPFFNASLRTQNGKAGVVLSDMFHDAMIATRSSVFVAVVVVVVVTVAVVWPLKTVSTSYPSTSTFRTALQLAREVIPAGFIDISPCSVSFFFHTKPRNFCLCFYIVVRSVTLPNLSLPRNIYTSILLATNRTMDSSSSLFHFAVLQWTLAARFTVDAAVESTAVYTMIQ